MYAKGWIFGSLCVMSLWNTTTCKIFVTKVTNATAPMTVIKLVSKIKKITQKVEGHTVFYMVKNF